MDFYTNLQEISIKLTLTNNHAEIESALSALDDLFDQDIPLTNEVVNQLYETFYEGHGGFIPYEIEKKGSENVDQSLAQIAAEYVSMKHMNSLQDQRHTEFQIGEQIQPQLAFQILVLE